MEIKKLKRAVIKEELVAVTGNHFEALILNQFMYWTERVKDFDKFIDEESQYFTDAQEIEVIEKLKSEGWIFKKASELCEELMLDISDNTLLKYINSLIEKEFIERRNNPQNRWDKTFQYRVNLKNLIEKLHEKGYVLSGYKYDTLYQQLTKHVIDKDNKTRDSKIEPRILKPEIQNLKPEIQSSNSEFDYNVSDITSDITIDTTIRQSDFSSEKLSICPICKFDKQKLYELVPVNEHLHCPYCEKDFDIKTLQEMKPKSQATDFLKWYKRRYEEEFKEPIDIVWSKDTQLVKGLLKTFKYDILQQKAELFLKIKDDDFINGTGHTIGKFKIKINALRKDTGKVVIRGPSEGFYAYK